MGQTAESELQAPPYELIGGEMTLRRLVDRFYDIMDSDPAAAELRAMHGADLAPMRRRLFEFMSGWLGGPRLYDDCIVSAHRSLRITARERDQWVMCMTRAMAEADLPKPLRDMLAPAFARVAGFFTSE